MKLTKVLCNRVVDMFYMNDGFAAWFDGLDNKVRESLMYDAEEVIRREIKEAGLVRPVPAEEVQV